MCEIPSARTVFENGFTHAHTFKHEYCTTVEEKRKKTLPNPMLKKPSVWSLVGMGYFE